MGVVTTYAHDGRQKMSMMHVWGHNSAVMTYTQLYTIKGTSAEVGHLFGM